MKPYLTFSILLLFISACAPGPYLYQPAKADSEPNSEIVYTQGSPMLRSKGNIEVVAELNTTGNRWLRLNLFLRNNTDSTITFNPELVRVTGFQNKSVSVPFEVFSADRYIQRRRNTNTIIGVAAAAAVVGTAVAIANTDGKSNNNDNNNNDNNDDDDFWWWYSTSLSPTVVIANGAIGDRRVAADGLFRRHTLYPDESVQGVIMVRGKNEYRNSVKVEIPLHDRTVTFVFDRPSNLNF